ncbi:MMPL family transporter [Calidifontibacter indicus]|uniref:MMPL family transporter n=1 Tax=Calidifontibacter indicus TaxID=419650 RepID=UPI003D71C6FD
MDTELLESPPQRRPVKQAHHAIAPWVCGKRTKWAVLAVWVLALVVLGPLAGKLADVQDNQASSWLPSSADSTKVIKELGVFMDPDSAPALVVYERASGITATDQQKVAADVRFFATLEGLSGKVVGPIPSADGKALQVVVPMHIDPKTGWNDLPDRADAIRHQTSVNANGLDAKLGGAVGFSADNAEAFAGLDSTLLFSTLGVVVIILLFTYRSPVLWLLPILSAGVALIAAQAAIYLAVDHFGLTVNGQSYGILTVLVIGAGTDYALLLVARYREELRKHEDRHEAMALALHRSGPAILASGSTVVLGMLCLLAADMNSTKGLGPVAAIGIVFSLLAMLTLLPALLVICGRWVFWPRRPTFGSTEPTTTGLWARVGQWIRPRPRAVWIGTALALAVCALGLTRLDANGLTTDESFTGSPDSVAAAKMLNAHYPTNAGNEAYITTSAAQATQVVAAAKGAGAAIETPPIVKGDRALVLANLKGDPLDQASYDQVDAVRTAVHAVPGANAKVGGTSATNKDVLDASTRDNKVIIPLTLAVVLLVLMVLLRAVLAPVLLILTVVLSMAAALGLSALIFEFGFGFGGADPSLPLFVFVFLVALGIDYNIFLMTRVREEALTKGTRPGALIALAATGGVITSAGLVLAATFGVLATMPVVAFVEIGFAVALGVLIDTIVVRAVLVTALNLDVGPKIWWPSKLQHVPDQVAA